MAAVARNERTEPTRYLCAAAYLDRKFRHWVREHILEDDHHALPAPAAVHLPTVVRHCLAAEQRKLIRDVLLSVLLLVGAYALLSNQLDLRAFGLGRMGPALRPALLPLGQTLTGVVLLALIVTTYELWDLRFSLLGRKLSRVSFEPASADVDLAPRTLERLADAEDETSQNVVVYSGFAPFVGAGENVGGWSFALNITRGKESLGDSRLDPLPFRLQDLYACVDEAVSNLALPGVSIRDKLYVNGRAIRDDPRFLAHPLARPMSRVAPELVASYVDQIAEPIRHYKRIEVLTWNGELVLSIFLRFAKMEQSLFMETSFFLLTPVHDGYRKIDKIPRHPTWRQRWNTLVEGVVLTPFVWLSAPFRVWGVVEHGLGRWGRNRTIRRLIEDDPAYDYGAVTTVREMARSQGYHVYFQRLDKEMYLKILEQQVLDATIEFLDRRNIDTSELRQRQTTILNSGLLVTGGAVSAENLAVGKRAVARTNRTAPSVATPSGGQGHGG